MRVNPFIAPAVFIAILIGILGIAQLTGNWSVSGRTEIDPTTTLAIADVKGWMSLQQIIDGIPIPKDELYQLVGIPADIPTTTALKDLESLIPGFETTTVRDVLTKRSEQTAPAATENTPIIVKPEAMVTSATPEPTATSMSNEQALPANQIKGKMTLQEISDQCRVSLMSLLAGLKLASDTDPATTIKTLIDQGVLTEVSQVQTVVAALQGS